MVFYCVGIDVSKDHFHAALCTGENLARMFSAVKKWKNDKTGFTQFMKWVLEKVPKKVEVHFLMEATGVYHERLAYFLHGKSKTVHVVLPNTSKHYFDSLNIKTKTDKLDAKVLSRFGVERKHTPWQPPKAFYRKLRDLTRYKLQLQKQKTGLSNIGHSKEYSADIARSIIRTNKRLINQLEKEIRAIKEQIEKLIASEPLLQEKIQKICTIKGVKIYTAASIIAETNGFEHFSSMKQLASFAGYDVVQHQSGTSVLKRGKMSKKGNSYIRATLYFPALSASRYCPELAMVYKNLLNRTNIKMKAQVAIQRKLLLLIYTLWKSNEEYIPGYSKIKVAKAKALTTQDSILETLP